MKKNILFVDDNRPLLLFISKRIIENGHILKTAEDGFEALDILSTYKPDIMFIDYFMPTIEGDKLIKIIRNMRDMENCHLVLISGGALEARINYKKIGADLFMAKGSFSQVADNVLKIINESTHADRGEVQQEIMGSDTVIPRYLTRELISRADHMRTILDSMEEGIIEVRNERIVYVNPSACSILETKAEEILAQYAHHLFFEIPKEKLTSVAEQPQIYKTTIERKGKTIVIRVQQIMGEIHSLLIFITDITLRENARKAREISEEALRDSEEKYRLLVENANAAIFIYQGNRILFPNPKAVAMMKKLGVISTSKNFTDFFHPDDRTEIIIKFRSIITRKNKSASHTLRLHSKSGEEQWVNINLVSIIWDEKRAILVFLQDITRQKEMEAQFQQAQRMKSVGTLAGGVAHDFNNLLMGIQSNISVMLLDIDEDHSVAKGLKRIEKRVKSGAHLTRQLLDFARGGKYKISLANLDHIIERTALVFGRTLTEARIHQTVCDGLWMVKVDVAQIEQVLLNLLINASQAMQGGGNIFIGTKNEILKHGYDRSRAFRIKTGKYVKVSVTDEGTGIPKKLQKHIFDPFFTTRELGTGTGLGLSSAYGIINNHNGFINCYSEMGHGTTINFYLPAIEETAVEAEMARPASAPTGESAMEAETILVIDDNAQIAKAISEMLKTIGYEVLTAISGTQGITTYKKHKDRIALVVLDLIMPDLSGEEVFCELKEINNDVKVLLSSGYSIDDVAEKILSQGGSGFLQKPYQTAEISMEIKNILGPQAGTIKQRPDEKKP